VAPPDPAGGAYNAPQTSLLDLRGLLLRGTEGKGKGKSRRGREMGGLGE